MDLSISVLLWKYKHNLSFYFSFFRLSSISPQSCSSFVFVLIHKQKYQRSINTFIMYQQKLVRYKHFLIKYRFIQVSQYRKLIPNTILIYNDTFHWLLWYWIEWMLSIVSISIRSLTSCYMMHESKFVENDLPIQILFSINHLTYNTS